MPATTPFSAAPRQRPPPPRRPARCRDALPAAATASLYALPAPDADSLHMCAAAAACPRPCPALPTPAGDARSLPRQPWHGPRVATGGGGTSARARGVGRSPSALRSPGITGACQLFVLLHQKVSARSLSLPPHGHNWITLYSFYKSGSVDSRLHALQLISSVLPPFYRNC